MSLEIKTSPAAVVRLDDGLEKAAGADGKANSGIDFHITASLLDAVDRPLIVSERGGKILCSNLYAQDFLHSNFPPSESPLNLFQDVLKMDSLAMMHQFEGGEQEVDLPLETAAGKARARIRWLPEPDWIVVSVERIAAEPIADESGANAVEMRHTVQELMQEREITYRNLLAAYLRLQEVNRQKTVFLASAAHELKTPLAVMKGYYDLLLSGSLGKLTERQRDMLQESKESCDRLVRLVAMFLNYSALESGKLVLQLRSNDIQDCIADVACRWDDAFQRAGVRLERHVDAGLPSFKFDYQKVQQCVANLIDNALKHTAAGGGVIIKASPHFWERRVATATPARERRAPRGAKINSVLIAVTDSGSGIASEYHQEIFEEFVRVDPSTSGMGLGLAITKRLIQAHRGKIWVDSEPGQGSCFSFILPMNAE